jgi:hypothetical protein
MQLLRLVVVILSLSLSVFASDSPFSGTWKLNLAKSKFTPPVPQSDIAVINADDNSIKFSEDVTDDKGQSTKMSTDAKFDGNDYPWTGDPDADSISYKRVNDHTLIATTKKAGKIAEKATIVVSKDGNVTTVHFTAYSQGKTVKGFTTKNESC